MSRTSAQLGATGSSTGSSVSVNLAYPQTSIKFFQPKTANGVIDLALTITQGGAQSLTATAGMASANTGVMGTVVVMTAIHAGMGVNESMYAIGAITLVKIPLSVGKNGQATNTFIVGGVSHFMTVDFYGWTPGTLMISGLTSKGVPSVPSTATAMGSFNLTANGGGTVTLVSAAVVRVDCALAQRRNASFTSLKLLFVPEPGTLLLLGAGALALAWRARRG